MSTIEHVCTTVWPSQRKRREWANFHAVRNGEVAGSRFEKRARSFLDDQVTEQSPGIPTSA